MKRPILLAIIFSFSLSCLTGCTKYNPFNYFSPSHVYRTEDNSIFLTFDDGPSENTGKILDLLKENNLKAAFFVTGQNAAKYPALVQRIVDEGHYLGNHTYSHRSLLTLSKAEAIEEVLKTEEIIAQYTSLRWFRPPYGEVSYKMSRWLENRGYKIIRWTAFAWNARPGDIVLMHETESDLKNLADIIDLINKNR